VNYKRPPRVFIRAYATEDTVSSQWLVRDGAGNEYKPEDYLATFARFVRENPGQIQAIRILLDRPQEWSGTALAELRQKLAACQYRFTVENLQKAHEIRYQRALVDIISMVKHAADEQQPLLSAQERVERAFERVTKGQTFTPDQEQWLTRIREHLRQSLSLDQEDFDLIPIFNREGGKAVVRRVFGNRLDTLIHQLNEAIAA
jgi:type I restriction enzyme, R subunit